MLMRPLHLATLTLATLTAVAQTPPVPANAWNGLWLLNPARSTPNIAEQAAEGYRPTPGPGNMIKWEVPSLGEVVTGHTDGIPMDIHRTKPAPGLTLAVIAEGPRILTYKVARNGKPEGEGRMMLVDNGTSCVDLTWPTGHPENAAELLYTRQP